MISRTILIVLIILTSLVIKSSGQNSQVAATLSLNNAVKMAITRSSSSRNVQNRDVNSYWRWQNYRTSFRPQLTLSGELPNYRHTNTPVTQPDGSILFKQVSNAFTSAILSLDQSIPILGTNIYAATTLMRSQDFIKNSSEYSGNPFTVGFTQPIFAYNAMKYSKKKEPLYYEEAQKLYIESVEKISLATTNRFFNYLRVQTDYKLAESNLRNSKNNLTIAEERRKLGRISENDFSRVQLSVYNAQKALNSAEMNLKDADFELKSYIGLDVSGFLNLILPLNFMFFDIDPEKALSEAIANRKETPEYERRLIEANESLDRAKKNSNISASLRGSYGMSNSAEYFPEIYENPAVQRTLRVIVNVPILDWGRSASMVKLAESRKDLVVYDVEKDQFDFQRSVIVQVEQFRLLREQLETTEKADEVAENGYLISLRKFQNGEISITDLNIALSEKDKAKRDYITSLREYWVAYYNLRILTLYDFETDRKIWHENPLLEEKNKH